MRRETCGRKPPLADFAVVAQLVERNLAKVQVTGSSPVYRSNLCGSGIVVVPHVAIVEIKMGSIPMTRSKFVVTAWMDTQKTWCVLP